MEERLKDSIPPHNLEAEMATLGALLIDWSSIGDIVTFLRPEHFYSQQNQIIYNALIKLFGTGISGDVLTLETELTKSNELEKAGGPAYIASLTDEVPSAANIDYYAHVVLDRATRRSLIKISSEIKTTAFDESRESRAILDEAEKKIFALADMGQTIQIHDMHEVVDKTTKIIQQQYHNHDSYSGIPCGFTRLDSMTSGFQKSELSIIGARPSMGKTAMALSMMENIAVNNKIPCGFFSLEMSFEQIGQRLLSQVARIPGHKIRSGMMKLDDLQKINDAAGRVFDAPIYIVDTPNMQLLDLRAMARRMVQSRQVQIIFIDYIGLISTQNPSAPVYEQVSEISKSLKSLARELNIPVVALCQVARDAEGNEPTLAQLRGSGSIEQDADVVMFIHRERKKTEEGEMEPVQDAKLIVAKQRNGPIGDVNLLFLSSYTKFENKVNED
ncbi:replicative DNA helicase [Treponema pectinovorum]|uniref:replicative DNA helicase n=1 Tax=Treponema pectinovorum TaxID=164 RepID=UPI0011C8C6AD|nr:replicative DNA helicase [Treponema pectinovorum]